MFQNQILQTDTDGNLYLNDGKRKVWRMKGTAHDPKHVKHGGGGVMVRAFMADNRTSLLVHIDDD